MKTCQLILIEDSPEYREVIAFGLGEDPRFEIVAQFNTADAALRYLKKETTLPDLLLLDLNLPGLSGIHAISDIKRLAPKMEILILTESEKETDIIEAIALGASGYLLKDASLNMIANGICTVLEGGASLDPQMARYILENNRNSSSEDNPLSARELETIKLVASGLSQKQIADKLEISHKTVDFHVRNVYKKLEVPNAPAAIATAYERKLFPIQSRLNNKESS